MLIMCNFFQKEGEKMPLHSNSPFGPFLPANSAPLLIHIIWEKQTQEKKTVYLQFHLPSPSLTLSSSCSSSTKMCILFGSVEIQPPSEFQNLKQTQEEGFQVVQTSRSSKKITSVDINYMQNVSNFLSQSLAEEKWMC